MAKTQRKNTTTYIAAKASFGGAFLFLVLLFLLHFLKSELDPSWRVVSEYEIGKFGWIMQLAFFSLALSSFSLFWAVRPQVKKISGYIGLFLLFLAGIGMVIGGVFTTDSIIATKDELTIHGSFHGLGALFAIPTFPIAAVLISRGLLKNSNWEKARKTITWATRATWITLLFFIAAMFILLPEHQGKFGPEVTIGWFNRAIVVAYAVWLMTVAKWAIKVK